MIHNSGWGDPATKMIKALNEEVKRLNAQLDRERVARRDAEAALVDLQRILGKKRAAHEETRRELDISNSMHEGMTYPAPCGHPSFLSHSDDGGKHIYCYQCQKEAAEERSDKFKWQVRDTCKRAETAERELSALKERFEKAEELWLARSPADEHWLFPSEPTWDGDEWQWEDGNQLLLGEFNSNLLPGQSVKVKLVRIVEG